MLEAVRLRPNAEQLKRLEQALTAKPQSLSEGYLARRQAGSIFLIPDQPGLPFPQGLRTPRPGDYLPMPYGHKRLVEFFAERGMPPELRKLWPVGAEGSEVQAVWQWWPHEPEDLIWMRRAIRAAKSVAEGGEVPVAAVIVQAGRALSPVCANTSEDLADATAHAELKAIQASLSSAGQKVLPPGSTLYVTLEPCLMCYGAALEARVSRIVWATENTKAGFFTAHKVVPKMPVKGGVLEQEAARLLGDFFGKLRVKVRNPRPGVSGH
jgi:tRNA(Ile)-lysidine synthase